MLCSVKKRRMQSTNWEKILSVSTSHEAQHGRQATEWFRPCGVRGAKSPKRGRVGGLGVPRTRPRHPGPRRGLRMSEATAGRATGRDTEATDACRARGLSGTEQETKVCEDKDRNVAA